MIDSLAQKAIFLVAMKDMVIVCLFMALNGLGEGQSTSSKTTSYKLLDSFILSKMMPVSTVQLHSEIYRVAESQKLQLG